MAAWREGGLGLSRRRVVSALGGVGLLAACAPWATAGPTLVDLSVVDRDSGRVLRTYAHAGRLFVAGAPGARYSLRVSNRTSRRVLVVMSVDGVNIISGQTASFNQSGYVLDAWQTYDLAGWRKSDSEIAAFEFASLGQSYAARTGRPGHVGVIGMAVFQERVAAPPPVAASPWNSAETAAGAARPAPPAPAAQRSEAEATPDSAPAGLRGNEAQEARRPSAMPTLPAEKLGTAHGQREWSVSSQTAFERATQRPVDVRQIEYDQFDNLVAAGVIRPYRGERRPDPFPGARTQPGFVPDPPAGG